MPGQISTTGKKILLKHVGNMGDLVFCIPPILKTLKRHYPDSHVTLVTAWGFKRKKRPILNPFKKIDSWGERNQGGFCISLMATNPHIDQLVHWHDTALALDGSICIEEGKRYPTWNRAYWQKVSTSGEYDLVAELDIGMLPTKNPLIRLYQAVSLPAETYSNYKLYFTSQDMAVAQKVTSAWPRPRIVLLEGLEGITTRGWDPGKIPLLVSEIQKKYGVSPILFGSRHIPFFEGRPLTLRENIATLAMCDVAIGVLSGPLHFAAAAGLPTITLYADQAIQRTAPGYFLNRYITDDLKKHRTVLGPSGKTIEFLKHDAPSQNLTAQEAAAQGNTSWLSPGKQSTKTPLAAITPQEIMLVLQDILR